jgi:virginiamycin B lyase
MTRLAARALVCLAVTTAALAAAQRAAAHRPPSSGGGGAWTEADTAGPTSSAVLALLPEGEEKRRFVLDCTGCHQMDARTAFPGGQARSRESWEEAIRRMLRYAGADTGFPVIAAGRDPAATAAWLTEHLAARPAEPPGVPSSVRGEAEIREYPHPFDRDLPHDLAVDREGRVVITGQMTHRMFRLDPESGAFAEVAIPLQGANPRAVEIDPRGRWWVLLGAPRKLAMHDPQSGEWAFHDIGMYPHSIGVDARGRAWFNGHFTKDPEQIGYVDPRTGEVRTFTVPKHPTLADQGGPVPYDLQLAPDGTVWGSELQGNRLFRFDPQSEAFEVFDMPVSWSGPRRFEADQRGALWIPEYASNRLTSFDPATRAFRSFDLPLPDALPYVVRVDRARGRVWIGTGAADAVLRFDPRTERFTVYPLPTRGALVRHMAVDPRTGDLWAAYGASPGIAPKIVRIRPAG